MMVYEGPAISQAIVPPAVIAQIKPCVGPRRIRLQSPNLVVKPVRHGASLTLHISLISLAPADGDLATRGKPLRAFVRVDRTTLLLSIPKQGDLTLSLGELSRGRHVLEYGVFAGDMFLNGDTECIAI